MVHLSINFRSAIKYKNISGRTYDPNEVRDITQRWVDNHMKRR